MMQKLLSVIIQMLLKENFAQIKSFKKKYKV